VKPSSAGGRDGGTATFENFRFDGLYDPDAAAPFRATLSLGSLKIDARARSGGQLKHFVIAQDGVAGELKARAGQRPGEIDILSTQSAAGSDQQTSIVSEDGEELGGADVKQGAAAGDSRVTGLRAEAIGELWRFLVAHIGKGPVSPQELKTKLAALAPLWSEAQSRGGADDVAVTFPGGSISAKSATQEGSLTGLAKHASATLALTVRDMNVDLADAPEWLGKVWPASLALKVKGDVDGLDRAAELALDDPGFLKTGVLGEAAKNAIRETLLAGHPRVSISETRLSTPLVEATFEGEAQFGDDMQAHAQVTSDDLDKLLEALADIAESEPKAQQLLYVVTFARGLARSDDGRLVWDIEYVPPNAVRVNGQLFARQP
jgi:hypothetical protein